MQFNPEFIKKHIIQHEGTFLKGFPIRNRLIALFAGIATFGFLVSVCTFVCLAILKNTVSYGILFGFSALFIIPTLPCIILLLRYNHKINFAKNQILSDENATYISIVVYKKYLDFKRKDIYKLQTEFDYQSEHIIITTEKYTSEYGVIPINREICVLYSPKVRDMIICNN